MAKKQKMMPFVIFLFDNLLDSEKRSTFAV